MRRVHHVLLGATALLLTVFTLADVGDPCNEDDDCGNICCKPNIGICVLNAGGTVRDGNAANSPCECDLFQRFDDQALTCGVCFDDTQCDGDFCCDGEDNLCSKFDAGSRSNGQSALFGCACADGTVLDLQFPYCVTAACDPGDNLCDDLHMQGLRGQQFDWFGVDGGWYSLVKDDSAGVHVNIRVTAPPPDASSGRRLVTGLSITSGGHSLAVEVANPYSIVTGGCGGVSPCLANGGLRAFVDGTEEDGLLRFSTREFVADGIAVSAANLPVACRQFGGDNIWARMFEEMLEGTLILKDETIEDWILKSRSIAAPEWCAKLLAEKNLADLQSAHAIFKIETSTVTVRLNVGVNHQSGGELEWGGRVLSELEFWQMDVGLDGLNIENPSLSGILGETARPVFDDYGSEVMEGFDAFRGMAEDYRVSGALGTHFALLDNFEEGHE